MNFEGWYIYFVLAVIGLLCGSFAGASVWRLRARQIIQDKKDGEEFDEREYSRLKKLTETKLSRDRSRCLSCSYQLKWYDLIPLFSWLSLGGKCRKCRKPIGYFEPIIEISVALFFVLSYALWPNKPILTEFDLIFFVLWLVAGIILAIIFAYDFKWYLIPDSMNFSFMGLGLINAILILVNTQYFSSTLIEIGLSLFILSGIYLGLYLYSKGKWIGFGDIKLGIGLALFLADWKLSFLALFLANLIGCLIVIPQLFTKKLKRDSHIPFGPLLVLGFIIAKFFGSAIVTFYMLSL